MLEDLAYWQTRVGSLFDMAAFLRKKKSTWCLTSISLCSIGIRPARGDNKAGGAQIEAQIGVAWSDEADSQIGSGTAKIGAWDKQWAEIAGLVIDNEAGRPINRAQFLLRAAVYNQIYSENVQGNEVDEGRLEQVWKGSVECAAGCEFGRFDHARPQDHRIDETSSN